MALNKGGILSPWLFCVYFDVLIDRITQSGYGCYTGLVFLAVFVYADDVVLLAPTATAMRHLLTISDIFATDFDVIFNAQKTKCIFLVVQLVN
jgi:Reverse transcriptase (RNA-dependent DNA polymerase)